LWFLHTVAANKGLLNIGADFVVKGCYEPTELRTAFAHAVRRHRVFGMQFALGPSGPVCSMLECPVIRWRVESVDSDHQSTAESLFRWIAKREQLPFVLEDGSLVRCCLYSPRSGFSVLSLTAHHLVADAWTLRLLADDVLGEWRRVRGEEALEPHPESSQIELIPPAGGSSHSSDVRELRESPLPAEIVLPVDFQSGTGGLQGYGDEVLLTLGEDLTSALRAECSSSGVTLFAGLLGALLLWMTEVCARPTAQAGVLASVRDLRHQRHDAGCHVRTAPVRIETGSAFDRSDLLSDVGAQLTDIRRRCRKGTLGFAGRFSVMATMIRESSVGMSPPRGIRVEFQRRRRVQAECELQVFFYERRESVEVVFNYDLGALSKTTVQTWVEGYRTAVRRICGHADSGLPGAVLSHSKSLKKGPVGNIQTELQHVGIAVWELDVGLRKLESVGWTCGESIERDEEQGVVMALSGAPGGTQLELIAPLRGDAPCVGFLRRDGEGPYHICWRVSDVREMLTALDGNSIDYAAIDSGRESALFPHEEHSFVVVSGIGLVEFLYGSGSDASPQRSEHPLEHLRIAIESDDMGNARRFLGLLGYSHAQGAPSGFPQEVWSTASDPHSFALLPSRRHTAPRIACVGSPWLCDQAALERGREAHDELAGQATTWWSRVMLGNTYPRV